MKGENKNTVLLAVTKNHSYEEIEELYGEGARLFGENRVQEIERKYPALRPAGMKIYLIGRLQSNKVRKAVALVDRIESVDSLSLARSIDREAFKIGKKIEILLEFNSSEEEEKGGFRGEEELIEAAYQIKEYKNILLKGLMTMGPREKDPSSAFEKTEKLFNRLLPVFSSVAVLSMGMSKDWKTAIRYGSTEVRIGTNIFLKQI